METVGHRVEQVLRALGISARELARRAGLGETQVSVLIARYKRNPESAASAEVLQKIAAAAGVRLEWLLSGEGDPEEPGGEHLELRHSDPERVLNPYLGRADNWDDVVASVRTLKPHIPEYVYERMASGGPLLRGPLTPAAVAALAEVLFQFEPPPPGASKKGK